MRCLLAYALVAGCGAMILAPVVRVATAARAELVSALRR